MIVRTEKVNLDKKPPLEVGVTIRVTLERSATIIVDDYEVELEVDEDGEKWEFINDIDSNYYEKVEKQIGFPQCDGWSIVDKEVEVVDDICSVTNLDKIAELELWKA